MFLHSIASAFPPYAYTQAECWDGIKVAPATEKLKPRSRSILERILLGDSGIEKRHFCIPDPPAVFLRDAGSLNEQFEEQAPAVAGEALKGALKQGGFRADSIDALLVCTCTGYLCPGVSSHLAEQFAMRTDTYLQDLVGLGCGAAIPTLRSASNFITANPEATVAVIAVEICSAAFYMDDDPGVLISLCLFGDGANASIWRGLPPKNGPAYQTGAFHTMHRPEDREKIRFVNSNGKLKNKLHRSVPEVAASAVSELYQSSGHNGDIDCVLAHPGGRDVVEALESALPVTRLEESRTVLRNYGNLSSPSVMIALEHHLKSDDPQDKLWLTSFGAGFACHSAEMTRVG